jgi:hypothetical protein
VGSGLQEFLGPLAHQFLLPLNTNTVKIRLQAREDAVVER